MVDKLKVAGVVVVYNSNKSIISNIKSYIGQIDKLFVIDNSEVPDIILIEEIKKIPNVVFKANNNNEGIAKALNQGALAAIEQGYDYLLTMDDDTSIPNNMVNEMLLFIENHKNIEIGILAPQSVPRLKSDTYKSAFIVITSGNLLNLNAYKRCGPFMDDLFIDWVDHEYCMRLKKYGYTIYELNYLFINHCLGNIKTIHILGLSIEWVSHSPIRLYYKTRNTLYVIREYARDIPLKFYLIFLFELSKDLVKNTLFENSKRKRIKYLIKAVIDYKNNKMGRVDLK